jgi:ABC-type lipoprotein release transport system permease subunit
VRALGVRLRAEARHGWRSWLALAVLIGAFSGVILGVAVGARRTQTAFPRLVERSGPSHALIGAFNTGLDGYYDEVAKRPEVAELGLLGGMPLFPLKNGEPVFISGNALAPIDGRFGYSLARPEILAGRLPRPDRAAEILVNEVVARDFHVRVGDPYPMALAQQDPTNPDAEEPAFSPVPPMRVVGIGRFVDEVVPTTKFDTSELILMTPAAWKRWGEGARLNFDAAYVRLRDPGSMPAFRAAAEAMAAADPEQTGGQVLFADHIERNRLVARTIGPQAFALWIFVAFAGVAGRFVLGQALSRQITDDGGEAPTLRALGLTRRQLRVLVLARAAVIVAVAVVIAVGVAIALSPLFPIGAARRAEPAGGLEVNLAILAIGALATVTLFLLRSLLPAWRLARAPLVPSQEWADGGRGRNRWSASSLPPTAATGVRMALEPGHGRTAVPVRATIAGAVIGLAAIAATATFAANMDRLLQTPRLYGRTWDVTFDGSFGPIPARKLTPILTKHPAVASWSGGRYSEGEIAGHPVTALGVDGDVTPAIVQGRAPRRDDEVALGTTTLRHVHRHVGDRVVLNLQGERHTLTVVGRAVFPAMGRGSFSQTGVGEGALTRAAVTPVPLDDETRAAVGNDTVFNFALIEIRADATKAQRNDLAKRLRNLCPPEQDCGIRIDPREERPAQIANLERIRWTPVVLAALLAVLAVATVGHTLVTSIRRRRRDLAMLKTIGFLRGQVSATVAWQATTIAAVAVIIGLPAGLALGRVLWRALADQMGVVPDVVTPAVTLAVAIPATLVLLNLIAVVPGWLAGRVRPAVALRAE